jgi:hypothetical protein
MKFPSETAMTRAAAFQGFYSDLRFIKTRSVAAITIEIPIEQASAFVAAFGAPTPGAEIPVAIARIDPKKLASEAPKPSGEAKERRRFHDLPLSQQAAMRCNEPAFWKFLLEQKIEGRIDSESAAAVAVRELCHCESRAELKRGTFIGDEWQGLEYEYQLWMQVPT